MNAQLGFLGNTSGRALEWLSRPGDPEFEKRLHKVVRRLMERFLAEIAAGA